MNQFAAKDDNDRLVAFQNILAERKKLELKIATKQEEADKEKNKQMLQTASSYTIDSIAKGLAELQLEFGGIVNGLSEKLAKATSRGDTS
jgi:N-acetyl-gamma-glutamylphosphate reductase